MKGKIGPLLNMEENLVTDDSKMAETFSAFKIKKKNLH